MKIWLKYIIGCILGIVFCFILPLGNSSITAVTDTLAELAVRIGRYALYPLLFFSFTVAVYELRDTRKLLRTGLTAAIVIVAAALILAFTGLISVLIKSPDRIPIFVEETSAVVSLNLKETLFQLFPYSGFEAFINGAAILPLCIFAGFAGAGCAADKNMAKPALTLFDSLSRVSYAVVSFFVDMFAIALIALSIRWMFEFRATAGSGIFTELILLLCIDFLFVALILYPAILRLILGKVNPYRVLYASLAAILTAFFSGDTNATLPVALRHANESLGVRRRISSVTMPLFSIFGRGGAALTVTVSFIVILKSYSSLGISIQDMLWISGVSILLSFLLGALPAGGPFIALAVLCSMYGRGFEAGYLILKPAAFFICSIAAAIDALTNMFSTYLIAQMKGMATHRDVRFFI